MKNLLVESEEELQKTKELLAKSIPTYRQAYSDRTAWVMACLSELSYLKFNEPIIDKNKAKLIKNVSKLIDEGKQSSLIKLIDLLAYDSEEERSKLKSDLQIINMKIEKTFDCNGTQAMLVSNDKFYVLVFRGTEVSSVEDIKADLKAVTKQCDTGGRIHSGFDEAFSEVHIEIQSYLNNLTEEKPLFITGHSLGGALATVATKKLTFKYGIAACYTYGSPRVGDEKWISNIKTPIYRLVNSADPVTMLPPGADVISLLTFFLKIIPVLKSFSMLFQSKFGGYCHAGDMRFLTNIRIGCFNDAMLLNSVTYWRRILAYTTKLNPWKELPSDHSITVYRKKLRAIAWKSNDK
ncbi:hypothetical protein SJPD1_0980 [Sulfurospirillum diekertiae]|uniref:Fungal lipase-type domain-containing protein n=1 Tax=Sulfurospirillum diekertiae TaxID=1854492 RepID=A0A290HC11_9BACT|nr:lipase family protein [Sulfurospirillum diekertiae]ATB69092.1 hypothetical protein SJPD1_0980 [Sulfurospirillum diekertiae]